MAAWLEPLLDAAEMRATDRWAIEERGIPSLELMEAAGRALADSTASLATELGVSGPGPIGVACGAGNNGGDGLVAARLLDQAGWAVEVVLTSTIERLSTDAAANLKRLPGSIPVVPAAGLEQIEALANRSSILIDALLGTGFRGQLREPMAGVIRVLNAAEAPVVAADIASGVDASNGEVASDAIKAARTVTFHSAKIGHLVAPGKRFTGELIVAPIGIPDRQSTRSRPLAGKILPAVLDDLSRRDSRSTKFSSGQVVIVGGSRGLTGAPCLAALATIRAGAGYATVAVPADLESIFEQKLTEVMSIACPGPPGRFGDESVAVALKACGRAAAALLGPGIGREEPTLGFARSLASQFEGPLVIDADGLAAFSGEKLEQLAGRQAPTVLTPHEGELGRLLNRPSTSISSQRVAAAMEAAGRAGAIVVLKGDDTLVTDGERLAVNNLAAPALATAGTGDVLGGVIAALLARIDDPFQAAAAAVFAHARAGQEAAATVGLAESVIASDVIAALPRGLRR